MPKKYVNKGVRKVINAETLAKTIEGVTDGKLTIRNAAKAYDINYSSLLRYTAGVKKEENVPGTSKAIEKQSDKRQQSKKFQHRKQVHQCLLYS